MSLLTSALCLGLLSLSQGFVIKAPGCVIDTNGNFPSPDPLLVRPGVKPTSVYEYKSAFYLPDPITGMLTLNDGDEVLLACPGPNNAVQSVGDAEVTATCVGDNKFQVGSNTPVYLDRLQCNKYPFHYAYRVDKCYQGTQTGIQIGFEVAGDFHTLIYNCFDETTLNTVYSYETVLPELAGYQHGAPRPSFLTADFYGGRNMYDVYDFDAQVAALTSLLGSSTLAHQYLKNDNLHFMAKGHYAPRADFIYGSHTRATFYFMNVGPQWQIFNGQHWEQLESATRDLAVARGNDLQVYTGPFGVMTLPDVNNNEVELYLVDGDKLAVPKFYWKAVYEPSSKAGVVVIGVNNPYIETPVQEEYVICPDVLSEITWYKSDSDIPAGYMYACEVDEFRKVVDALPAFETTSLLK